MRTVHATLRQRQRGVLDYLTQACHAALHHLAAHLRCSRDTPMTRPNQALHTPPTLGRERLRFQRLDERRALDDRFALRVFIGLPMKPHYEELVVDRARRAGGGTGDDELLAEFRVGRTRHNHDLLGACGLVPARYPDCARRGSAG